MLDVLKYLAQNAVYFLFFGSKQLMIAKAILSNIADQIINLPQTEDLKSNVQQILARQLNKMNLVSRDEFDAQQAVLLRTRKKLEALEKQLEEIEKKLES